MSKVTIFSNKTVVFNHPKDYSIKHGVDAFAFAKVPEWVLDSKMFRLLKKDNAVRVIESNKDLKDVEMAGKAGQELFKVSTEENPINEEVIEESVEEDDEAEAEVETEVETETGGLDLENMSGKQLYNYAVNKGLNVEPKQKRAVYLEAILESERTAE